MNPEEMLWSCIPHPSQSCRKHFQIRKLDIVNDPDFKEAINAVFAMCTKIKKGGRRRCDAQDLNCRPYFQKLFTPFNLEDAEGLQESVC